MFKCLTSLLRHLYVNRLVWTSFLHEEISIPVHLYRETFAILTQLFAALRITPEPP